MNSQINNIGESIKRILESIPPGVLLLAAAKTRTLEEVEAAIQAGVTDFGYNYVQEALPIIQTIGSRAKWHMIGHLQQNKAKIAVEHFDMIETVDFMAPCPNFRASLCKYTEEDAGSGGSQQRS